MLNFPIFVPLNETLATTFNEMRAPTYRKYVAEQCILMPNLSDTNKSFWSHSSVFVLEKQPEKLNFHSFFTSKRTFGWYFQSKTCTKFQKTCS